jgi:hypothetical protein
MSKPRIQYQLTDADLKKAAKFAAAAADRKERTEAKPSSNKKVQAAKRQAASMDALKGNPEYHRGIWQGRIDNARGLAYTEERTESAFNLGYYRGYTDLERDLKGGLVIPEQYLA